MFETILNKAPIFLLVCSRCAAMIMTLPLFSTRTVHMGAKVALVGYMAYLSMGSANYEAYLSMMNENGAFDLNYLLLMVGEAFIGIIMGFYVSIIFAAFSSAGQFFSFQMGFSASEVYDALSQVENPLMGQYFNLVAMLIFLQNQWLQKLFLHGLFESFKSMNVFSLLDQKESLLKFLVSGLSNLFADAMLIALPIMGSLLLITVCTGLLSKAAPQMNLLSEGFPVMILLTFGVLFAWFPEICSFFQRSFMTGVNNLSIFVQRFNKGV